MEDYKEIQKYEIYLNLVQDSGFTNGYGFLHSNNEIEFNPEFDFHIPIFIKKSYDIYEYVNITKDENVFDIERQLINPFFLEFSFFDTIKTNKTMYGNNLTSDMADFIKSKRTETSGFTYNQMVNWFDDIGVHQLPWNIGGEFIGFDEIDKAGVNVENIISKANFKNININK